MEREVTAGPGRCPPRAADWLDAEERATWLVLAGLLTRLPAAMDAQLQHDEGLTFFEYTVLAVLSEQPDRSQRMSELAALAHGSPSRLSHVIRRLETRGFVRRRPCPDDGRYTEAILTDVGQNKIEEAAPRHVANVRAMFFDLLTPEQQRAFCTAALQVLVAVAPETPQVLADHGVCVEPIRP